MMKKLFAISVGLVLSGGSLATEKWNYETAYSAGDVVIHKNESFVSSHWTQGSEPVVNEISWDGWIHLNKNSIEVYAHDTAYNGGSIVNFEGQVYLAKWWVKGEYPIQSATWRVLEDFHLDPTEPPITEPDQNDDPKSPKAIHGLDKDGDGIRDSYKLAVLQKYDAPEMVQLALSVSHEYHDLHTIAFDDTIEMSPEDAATKLNSIRAFEKCANTLVEQGVIQDTPLNLYADTIYRALYYRLGAERLFAQTGNNLRALKTLDQPCPLALVKEAN